jgi:aspartate aminotransferase
MVVSMRISNYMNGSIKRSSLVRQMFEEGLKLKALHGQDSVFDYSLGNPDLKPPLKFESSLIRILETSNGEGHGYMPNAGEMSVRIAMAKHLKKMVGANLSKHLAPEMVIMTVGAAGALNVILKTILDPGDNVIVLAPYFMEYNFYVENHGGLVKVAQTTESFRPDPKAISDLIDDKTRSVLINTPNNPTGAVYSKSELLAVSEILARKSENRDRPIYLISDEPYRKIIFGAEAQSIFECCQNSIMVNSFSKELSIPGERLGYVCLNPMMEGWEEVAAAASMANRILGFVNAPALAQRVVSELLEEVVDVSIYQRRVELLARALIGMGYKLRAPEGTFYLFPESPIRDDMAFVQILKESLILAVPGSGFGRAGHFRLSLCLGEDKISRSLTGFKIAMEKAMALGQN